MTYQIRFRAAIHIHIISGSADGQEIFSKFIFRNPKQHQQDHEKRSGSVEIDPCLWENDR